ncbi:MAG: TolC family protein [Hylemonella sp.]|uniref:TolC family protein n=1 Tax=Hylemonella sp. TaxID=2066020 RepID=UPI0022C0AD06|nr:TolC family protein [Hylemonella sp.]MCZ8250987.1 TolC family protein [Hylemonella sp.]
MKKTKIWRHGAASLLLWPAVVLAQSADPMSAPPAPMAAAPAAASAEEPVTAYELDALIQLVLTHNPNLQGALRLREQAEAGITTARAFANPRVEYSQGRNQALVPSAVPGDVHNWTVSQFLENPSLRGARIEAAKAGQTASFHQVALTRSELIAQVQLRSFEYFLRRDEAAALSADVVLLEQVRDRVRARVNSGEAARYEIIKADAEIINARQRQRSAVLLAEQALLSLNRLAAGQLPRNWILKGELDAVQPFGELEELLSLAKLSNPELKVLNSQLDRARRQLEGARSSRWPGLDLRYSQNTAPDIRQNVLGVQVQIPLFDQKRGPIAEAGKEYERARLRLDGRQAELEQQIIVAWKSLEMARIRVEALSQGVMRDAEAALRVAQAAYRFGERGILDVLDAQRVLQAVRSDLLDARFSVQAARIELELLTGRYAGESNP